MNDTIETTQGNDSAWSLVNREGSRLLQYGYPKCEDEAQRLLVCARQRHPDAGIHLERVEL